MADAENRVLLEPWLMVFTAVLVRVVGVRVCDNTSKGYFRRAVKEKVEALVELTKLPFRSLFGASPNFSLPPRRGHPSKTAGMTLLDVPIEGGETTITFMRRHMFSFMERLARDHGGIFGDFEKALYDKLVSRAIEAGRHPSEELPQLTLALDALRLHLTEAISDHEKRLQGLEATQATHTQLLKDQAMQIEGLKRKIQQIKIDGNKKGNGHQHKRRK